MCWCYRWNCVHLCWKRLDIEWLSVENNRLPNSHISLINANETVIETVSKAKQQPVRPRSISKRPQLSVKIKSGLMKIFVEQILYYGLSIIVLSVSDSTKLKSLLNNARRSIIGLRSHKAIKSWLGGFLREIS